MGFEDSESGRAENISIVSNKNFRKKNCVKLGS